MSRKALLIAVAIVLVINIDVAVAANFEWWNSTWKYRVGITINNSGYNRTNWPVEIFINFSDFGYEGTFDNNSIRVIEYWPNGSIKDVGDGNGIRSQFDEVIGYDATSNAAGEVVWLMEGNRTANTLYYYFIYFDFIEEGAKTPPNYTSQLTFHNESGTEFWVNNSLLEIKVDTYNHLNRTTGMYYAKFRNGSLLFNAPASELPIEYIQLTDQDGNAYEYNFQKNFKVIVDGPLKKVIELEGCEIQWGDGVSNPTCTGLGSMVKRYTFYEGNPWIKIEHIFTFNSSSISRTTSAPTAPLLDIGRTAISGVPLGNYYGSTNDPYSFASVYKSSPPIGLGIVNLNETGTNEYRAETVPGAGQIGIMISSIVNAPKGSSISETAAIYFNNQGSNDPVIEFRNKLKDDVKITVGVAEKWELRVQAQTDHTYYNRNETALVMGNITVDTNNMTYLVNATLDMGTLSSADDLTLTLYDDGTHGDISAGDGIFTNTYTFPTDAALGSWTYTVRVYDKDGFLLNESSSSFTVTDRYNMEIKFKDLYGLVNITTFYVNVTVKNYRNDTGIEGDLYCEYNSTIVDNKTYLGGGIYTLNFSAPQEEGEWNFSCNLSKANNSAFAWQTFYTYIAKNTTVVTNITSNTSIVEGITQDAGKNFSVTVNATNIEMGMAYNTNISLQLPIGWSSTPQKYECDNIPPRSESCIRDFNVTVPAGTPPGNYTVTAITTWLNYDGNISSSQDYWVVEVTSNPKLEIVETELIGTVIEGTSQYIGNFTIRSAGNDKLLNVTISCYAPSGGVCDAANFTVILSPQNVSEIAAGATISIAVNISAKEGLPPGIYDTGVIDAYASNDDFDSILINVTVPESKTWELTPLSCNKTVAVNMTGEICPVIVNNTGNVNLSFNISWTGNGTAYSYSNETNFTIPPTSSHSIEILYNTYGASVGTYTAIYTVSGITLGTEPPERNITVNIRVELGPEVNIALSPIKTEQGQEITINATLLDKIGEGIEWVKANVTTPIGNILPVTLYNTSDNIPWGESNWSGIFTDTMERGNYTVVVYAKDLAGGYGESLPLNFTIYAKLQVNVSVGDVYKPGSSGSFLITVGDLKGDLIQGATVTVDIISEHGGHYGLLDGASWPKTTTTGDKGTASVSFELTGDAKDVYSWTVDVNYTDPIGGQNVSANSSGAFFVGSLEVSTSAGDQYSPGDTVTILTTVIKNGELSQVDNVTVEIALNNTIIATINSTVIPGPAYLAEYEIPTNATAGTYVVTATATFGAIQSSDVDTFTILEAGPSSLQLDLDAGGPYRPGDTVLIKTEVRDQNNEHLQGANITLRVEDPNGIVISEQNLTNFSSPSYVNLTLLTNATEGTYRVYGEAHYGSKSTSDIELFDVYKSLFAQIGVLPVYYLNSTMEISVMILDPDTGSGVDPDEITLNLYNTENSTLTLTHSLSMANLTRESAGFYTYSENLTNATPTGSYLALLEVTYGTIRAWGMETFRISSGVFDIKFESVSSPIPRGGDLEFTITLTYFGEATTRDITLEYAIVGTTYSGSDTFKNPDPNTPTTINRTISNVDLPEGTYTLRASVIYDPAAPPAVSEIQFEVTSGEAAPPPMVGGGGGGAAPEEVGPPALSISHVLPEEVHVERGGSAVLMVTINNSGEAAIHGISISLEGINRSWYEVVKSTTTLEAGETFDILIKITVPEETKGGVYPFNVTVTSQEAAAKAAARIRVFESRKELVEFELEVAEKRLRTVEKRLLKAMSEGRNVTEGLDYIDKAAESLSEAKRYLKAGEYSKALFAIEAAMTHLDRVNEIIDKASITIIKEITPTVTPQPTPVIPTKMLIGIGALILVLIVIVAFFGIKWYKSFKEFAENINMRIGPVRSVPQPREKKSSKPTRPTTEKKSLPKPSDKFLELRAERDKVRKLLDMLNAQRRDGLISKTTYRELKEKNEKRLREIEEKLKELS